MFTGVAWRMARRVVILAVGFSIVLACLVAGDRIAKTLPIPLPGALVGMVLLAAILAKHRGRVAVVVNDASALLLRRYALFFVPAGVGAMKEVGALRGDWGPVAAALIISSLLALAATALTMRTLLGWRDAGPKKASAGVGHDN